MTDENAGSGQGRRSPGVAVVIAAVLAVGAVLTLLAAADSGQGTAAIDQVRRAVAPELRDIERRIEDQGGTLRVSWSASPSPSGGGYVVMARVAVEPSGDVGTARFGVRGDRVVAQGQLAQQLLEGPAGP